MVILAGWRAGWAAIACVAVAAAESLRILMQVTDVPIPRELAPLVPYILTLVVLVVLGGKRRPPPASLGKL